MRSLLSRGSVPLVLVCNEFVGRGRLTLVHVPLRLSINQTRSISKWRLPCRLRNTSSRVASPFWTGALSNSNPLFSEKFGGSAVSGENVRCGVCPVVHSMHGASADSVSMRSESLYTNTPHRNHARTMHATYGTRRPLPAASYVCCLRGVTACTAAQPACSMRC